MKNILNILEGLGIEVPEDKKSSLEKEVHENYRTKKDYDDQVEKVTTTQNLLDETTEKLKAFENVDVTELQNKLKEATETLENERKDRKEKEAEAERHNTVSEYLKEKKFVNDITRNAITAGLEKKLSDESAKGKSMDELFNSMVKDADGKDIPNILVTEQAEANAGSAAVFTEPMNGQADTKITGDPNKMDFQTYKKWREQNS